MADEGPVRKIREHGEGDYRTAGIGVNDEKKIPSFNHTELHGKVFEAGGSRAGYGRGAAFHEHCRSIRPAETAAGRAGSLPQ
jgi:hypothetical protein